MRFWTILLGFSLLLGACKMGSRTQRGQEAAGNTNSQTAAQPSNPTAKMGYKFYVDNSYSMNGYFKGQTEFLSAVNRLITQASIQAEDQGTFCNLYSFNNDINFCGNTNDTHIDAYLRKISGFFATDSRGNRSRTDLKDILTTIYDSAANEYVSVVVTDAIASPGLHGQDAETYFDIMANTLFKTVSRKLAQTGVSTAIIKCNSTFNGVYINQNNKGVRYDGATRPYYVIAIGQESGVRSIQEILKKAGDVSGYEDAFVLTGAKTSSIRTKLVPTPDYELTAGAKELRIMNRNKKSDKIRLSLLLDLRSLPVSEEYLMDPANYEVSPPADRVTITPIANPDDPANKGYSHKMVVVTNNRKVDHNITVALKYEMPNWVYESSTNSDLNMKASAEQQKTLGLLSVVEGVQSGYRHRGLANRYFSLDVQVLN